LPQDRLTNLLKPAVLDAGAYNMAESTDMIKLDAMENPFTWPAAVQQEWLNTLANTDVNRYPDGSASHIKKSCAGCSIFPLPTASYSARLG